MAGTRTKIHNRVNKCNADMAIALGGQPAVGELKEIRLKKLMQEDEWGGASDQPRHERGTHSLRIAAEFRPVDMPSARGPGWRALGVTDVHGQGNPVHKQAMDTELKVLVARAEEELGIIRTRIVDQANTYLRRIRSGGGNEKRGYGMMNAAYTQAHEQGRAVRLHAQIYNMCVSKIRRLSEGMGASLPEFRSAVQRYRYLESKDLVCSTATYSTRGTSPNFTLPWFWRMSQLQEENAELASQRDQEFVSECESRIHQRCRFPNLMIPVFRIRWINAKCALTRCAEELKILRFEMQMCYLGYVSRAKSWDQKRRIMRHSKGHKAVAEEYASNWRDMAALAKERFNLCIQNVIHDGLLQ